MVDVPPVHNSNADDAGIPRRLYAQQREQHAVAQRLNSELSVSSD